MKIFNYLTILILSTFLVVSCGSDTKPKKTGKAKKTAKAGKGKKKPAKKINAKQAYWNDIKKATGINDKQVAGMKAIDAKYSTKIAALKKNKKWEGKANTKTRMTTTKAKEAERKKLLGADKYIKYKKHLTAKSKKAKKPKAKKATKKK